MNSEQQRAIEALMLRYATAADSRDKALLASCFTADVKADYGTQIGRFQDRASLAGHLSEMLGQLGPTLHFITNVVVSPAPAGLKVRSYTHAVVNVPGVEAPIRTAGIYDDLVVETKDGWQIKERVYTSVA